MSATIAIDRKFSAAESCPDCGRKLLVSWECGYCGWTDRAEAKLMGVTIENDEELRQAGKWSLSHMTMLMIGSLLIPFFGVFASIYGMFDDRKRKQGAFLLIFTVIASALMRLWMTAFTTLNS
jgi:Zn ribbon nucleic-acid-binding protein